MKRIFILLSLMVGFVAGSHAQLNTACPGLHNPANFNVFPGGAGSWSARVGDRVSGTGGSTGSNVLSTCANPAKTPIRGANILSSTYYSGYCNKRDACGHASLFDGHDHRFSIYTSADAGLDLFTVNAAGQGMQRIPAGHLSSIRLGDMRATGSCQTSVTSTSGNNKGAEALFYTMRVNSQNALLFIDYAIVACRYDHTAQQAGEFLIRVVGKNATTGQWNNFPLNDSLWFNVPAPATTATLPAPWIGGLNGNPTAAAGTSCCYCYKDWTRVSISLLNYLYDSVRVEMYTSDCIYDYDPIYAYIAGDCQPMTITNSGCPGGSSDAVDTLRAPEGLLSYQWYVAADGFSGNPNSSDMSAVPFRAITGNNTNTLVARLSDFVTNTGETVGTTTYKCVMTSAMDPNKPFHSTLYSTVSNTKPVLDANFTYHCDGTVEFEGIGTIYYQGVNAPRIVDSLVTWEICSGSQGDTPVIDTVMGRIASYKFTDSQTHAVNLTMYTSDGGCYTTQTFLVHPTVPANNEIAIEKRTLCAGASDNVSETANITDLTTGITARQWVFADRIINSQDPGGTMENTRVVSRTFTEFENPFMLITTSNSGCLDTLYDTIYFFKDPEIIFSPDTIICYGHETNVKVSTPVPGCTFDWYKDKDRPETHISTGSTLHVRPTQSNTTYYVKITSESGCEVWSSVNIGILNTKMDVYPKNGKFCPDSTVTLTGHGAVWYEWYSEPNDPDLLTQAHEQTIVVHPDVPTRYYMIGYAADSCDINPINALVQPVGLPVLDFEYSPHFIDTEIPVVNFTDNSENRDHTQWSFTDGSQTSGQNVTHHFDIYVEDGNCITLKSFNEIGCYVDTTFCIAIDTFGLYIPNVFVPSKGENNKFQVVCPSGMDKFHIAIYNRRGLLVFESDDINFVWDGTRNGTPLPTGAYPYVVTYTRAGSESDFRVKGTVTLIR